MSEVLTKIEKTNGGIDRFDIFATDYHGSSPTGEFKNNLTISKYNNLGNYEITSGRLKLTTTQDSIGNCRAFYKINYDFSSFLGKNKRLHWTYYVQSLNDIQDAVLGFDAAPLSGFRQGWGNATLISQPGGSVLIDSILSASYPYLIITFYANSSGKSVFITDIYIE